MKVRQGRGRRCQQPYAHENSAEPSDESIVARTRKATATRRVSKSKITLTHAVGGGKKRAALKGCAKAGALASKSSKNEEPLLAGRKRLRRASYIESNSRQ